MFSQSQDDILTRLAIEELRKVRPPLEGKIKIATAFRKETMKHYPLYAIIHLPKPVAKEYFVFSSGMKEMPAKAYMYGLAVVVVPADYDNGGRTPVVVWI